MSVSAPLAREERVGAIGKASTLTGEEHFVDGLIVLRRTLRV